MRQPVVALVLDRLLQDAAYSLTDCRTMWHSNEAQQHGGEAFGPLQRCK